MHPGTIINDWIDQSQIGSLNVQTVETKPLFLTASSFPKGPEELTRVSGENFYKLYGTDIKFSEHGQPAIQAAAVIDAGGELLVKRVVAEDSTLANIIFLATVNTDTVQKTNDQGDLLYIDDNGEETTTETDTIAIASTSASIKWSAVSIENCRSFDEVKEQAAKLYDPENGVYPILYVADVGRGNIIKSIRLTPNNEISISMGHEFFTVSIYEGTTRVDSGTATFDSIVYKKRNYCFNEQSSSQLQMYVDEDAYDAYVQLLSDISGIEVDQVRTYNLLNGTTARGAKIPSINIDEDSIDLNTMYGISLASGSNGSFGDKPANTEAWTKQLVNFFDGSYTNAIYDLDDYKIGAVVDACYPYEVKEAIAKLVDFRADCVFLRDMCLDVHSYSDALLIKNNFTINNKFIANYLTYYQIYDPSTRRKIKVTMMYDLAQCLVNGFNSGIENPTAGIANGYILSSAIEGTLNFVPRIIPTVNQKELLDDLRVNYAIFYEGDCIVQSLYSSQDEYTQLSFINNVMAIQKIIRVIRSVCPKKRYTFINGGDFTTYANDVQDVLDEYKDSFDILQFEYTKNILESNNKIFHASIKFAFKDWAQTEIFDIYAINNNALDNR